MGCMSSRVVGKGKCPKCGRVGSVVLKEISGRVYVYFKHGRDWCYVGPLDRVNLSGLVVELSASPYHGITTKLGLAIKDLVYRLRRKLLRYVLIEILAIILIVMGIALTASIALAVLGMSGSLVMESSEEYLVRQGDVIIINPKSNNKLSTVEIRCQGCSFRVGDKKVLVKEPSPNCLLVTLCRLNKTYVNTDLFPSSSTTHIVVKTKESLVVLIESVKGNNSRVEIRMTTHSSDEVNLITSITVLLPGFLIVGLLVWVGVRLLRWARR